MAQMPECVVILREVLRVPCSLGDFDISFDQESQCVSVDGVNVSAELMRMIFVAPDPERKFSLRREGNTVTAQLG